MFYIVSIICLLIAMLCGFFLTLRMNKKIEEEEHSSKTETNFPPE